MSDKGMSDEEEGSGRAGVLGKVVLAAGLTAASLARDAPPLGLLGRVCLASTLCASPGLIDAHLGVSYGFGASLACQAALFAHRAAHWPSRLLLLAYALYGAKVCLFQAARDARPDYVEKVLAEGRERSPRGFSARRTPAVLTIAVLLSCFCLPLHAATRSPTLGVGVGAAVALGGLLLQTVADVQKFECKRRGGADALCVTGLWARSRHANYLGEIYFHIGIALAALSGAWAARSPAAALLGGLAPGAFVAVMLGATARLERRQLEAYGDDPNYRAWVKATPRLFLGARRAGADAGSPLPSSSGDASLEEVTQREERDLLGTGIANIVAVTGAAGASTAVLGAIGWATAIVLPGL